MKNITIENAVDSPFLVTVGEKAYRVQYTPVQTVKAEAAIGRPLTWVGDWMRLTNEELPKVLLAGIEGLEPEAEAALMQGLNPETLFEVREALCWLTWPKAMREYQERARKKITSPNEPGGDVL